MNSDTWKKMTLKEKAEWLIHYYGMAALCAAAGILVVGYLIFSMLGGNDEEYALSVLILDDRVDTERCEKLENELEKILDGQVEVVSYTSAVMEQMQAFSVRTTAGGIDLLIAPENEVRQLDENQYFSGDYRILQEESRYEKLVYEKAAMGYAAPYIGVVNTGENKDNAVAAMEYLSAFE